MLFKISQYFFFYCILIKYILVRIRDFLQKLKILPTSNLNLLKVSVFK